MRIDRGGVPSTVKSTIQIAVGVPQPPQGHHWKTVKLTETGRNENELPS